MKEAKQSAIMFGVGCSCYPLLEIAYRGFTHWSMSIAGGAACLWLHTVNKKFKKISIWQKGLLGAFGICLVEFAAGWVVNIKLGLDVWDYSHHPLNIKGQVCPLFFAIWYMISIPVMKGEEYILKTEGRKLFQVKSRP